jgi:predicted HTH transcriptional regulator
VENLEFDIYPVIAQGMSSKRHWCIEDVPMVELAAVLVGMANTEGGSIYLGVNPDSGKIEGLQDIPLVIDRLFQACLLSEPALILPVPKVKADRHRQYLHASCESC